jgi:hypothetical protein
MILVPSLVKSLVAAIVCRQTLCASSFKSVQVCFVAEKVALLVVVHVHLGRMCNLLLEAVIY